MTRLQSSFPSRLPSGATSTKGHLSGIRHHAGYSEHDEILDAVDQLASWQEHAHTVSEGGQTGCEEHIRYYTLALRALEAKQTCVAYRSEVSHASMERDCSQPVPSSESSPARVARLQREVEVGQDRLQANATRMTEMWAAFRTDDTPYVTLAKNRWPSSTVNEAQTLLAARNLLARSTRQIEDDLYSKKVELTERHSHIQINSLPETAEIKQRLAMIHAYEEEFFTTILDLCYLESQGDGSDADVQCMREAAQVCCERWAPNWGELRRLQHKTDTDFWTKHAIPEPFLVSWGIDCGPAAYLSPEATYLSAETSSA